MNHDKSGRKRNTIGYIHRRIFITQMILILTLALFLSGAGIFINVHFETQKRDRNLQNVAESIAHSPILDNVSSEEENQVNRRIVLEYLDALKSTLADIDVISVVNAGDNTRFYHSNHNLIDTVYDGTLPEFIKGEKDFYTANDLGPSGTQRRAYAAVYDADGNYIGFVIAVMLMENIHAETLQTLGIFSMITLAAILMELIVSAELSRSIKKQLHGYEPNVFSAMFQIRDDILESLDEGVIAVDAAGTVQFINKACVRMLAGEKKASDIIHKPLGAICHADIFTRTVTTGEKDFNAQDVRLHNENILIDRIPIKRGNKILGAVGILHDRAEFTKLMEDLTGTRYLVDSMRANNHDFTNKLHVILGLIQMGLYDEASSYIENISMVQRATIHRIMSAVREPDIAALLIGKTARASELNVKFVMREGCSYSKTDYPIPSETLITIIGNLIENAFEAMNGAESYDNAKELLFGIFSKPGALLITADDTGVGISEQALEKIFENGYSTKGEGRGTGLYQVKTLVDSLGGRISVESQPGVGTSFSISFSKDGGKE